MCQLKGVVDSGLVGGSIRYLVYVEIEIGIECEPCFHFPLALPQRIQVRFVLASYT